MAFIIRREPKAPRRNIVVAHEKVIRSGESLADLVDWGACLGFSPDQIQLENYSRKQYRLVVYLPEPHDVWLPKWVAYEEAMLEYEAWLEANREAMEAEELRRVQAREASRAGHERKRREALRSKIADLNSQLEAMED